MLDGWEWMGRCRGRDGSSVPDARYAEHDASVAIDPLDVLEGSLPTGALALVLEWGQLHQDELAANWERARRKDPLEEIDPLP